MFITIINEYYYRQAEKERERERKNTRVNERVSWRQVFVKEQPVARQTRRDTLARGSSYLCQRFENCDGKTDAPLCVITGNNFVTIHGRFSCALKAAIRWMRYPFSRIYIYILPTK